MEAVLRYQIVIDVYRCNSCGSCVEICPEKFYMNENTDKAEVADNDWWDQALIEQAISICPVQCIELIVKD